MFDSVIREVKFYRSGFIAEALGKVVLEKGRQTVRISGLVRGLDDSTIRLFLDNRIYGSNIQLRTLTEEEKKELTGEALNAVARQAQKIDIREKMSDVWLNNADFSQRDNVNVGDIDEYMDKLPQRLEENEEQILQLQKELELLNKALKKKQEEAERNYLSVDMVAEEAGEYGFKLSYYVPDAYWGPDYEIHTDDEKNEVTVRLRARIRQNSDVDLKDVKVRLFTGNPGISGTIPTLYPKYVRFYEPVSSGARANALGSMKTMAFQESAMAMEEMEDTEVAFDEVSAPQARVSYGDTMVEYDLNGTWNINKKEDVMVDISSKTVSCRYHDVCIPISDDGAYLAAEVNTADLEDLLNTEASVYQNGAYMGKVYLNLDPSKEKYDISLGRDETVKVKRTQVRKNTSTVLLKGQKKTEYEFEINVNSTKPKTCYLTLLDQIPVSQDKSIIIEQKELSGGTLNADRGEVKWELELQPSEGRTLKLAYDVSWPKDKRISL